MSESQSAIRVLAFGHHGRRLGGREGSKDCLGWAASEESHGRVGRRSVGRSVAGVRSARQETPELKRIRSVWAWGRLRGEGSHESMPSSREQCATQSFRWATGTSRRRPTRKLGISPDKISG